MRLNEDFYKLNALELAPKLIGMKLCRKINGKIFKFKITETESYFGEEDTACHAHKGRTKRTEAMYYAGGISYIYLCYGMY